MKNVPALTRREINAAFLSPMAYIVLTLFLFFSGFFFYLITAQDLKATMSGTVGVISFLLLVATPLLTMRLLSEEFRSGTIEMLVTAPVTDAEIVLGKFFGGLAFLLFVLLPTLGYVVILKALGDPDMGVVVASYVGLALAGAQFVALGVCCSAATRSQIVAGVLALVLLVVVWVLGAVGESITGPFAAILIYAGAEQHLRPFTAGRIVFRDVFYFLSVTCFWLFMAVRVLESRRWRM